MKLVIKNDENDDKLVNPNKKSINSLNIFYYHFILTNNSRPPNKASSDILPVI